MDMTTYGGINTFHVMKYGFRYDYAWGLGANSRISGCETKVSAGSGIASLVLGACQWFGMYGEELLGGFNLAEFRVVPVHSVYDIGATARRLAAKLSFCW